MIALRSKMDNCLLFHSLQSTTTDTPVLCVHFSCSEPRPTERNWPVVFLRMASWIIIITGLLQFLELSGLSCSFLLF